MKGRNIIIVLAALLLALPSFCENTVEVTMKTAGTLHQQLTEEQRLSCTTLIVHGHINSSDIQTIREMARCTKDSQQGGCLQVLDIQDAVIDKDKRPYLTIDIEEERMLIRLRAGAVSASRVQSARAPGSAMNISQDYKNALGSVWDTPRTTEFSLNLYLSVEDPSDIEVNTFDKRERWISPSSETDWSLFKQTNVYKGAGYAFLERDGHHYYQANTEKGKVSDVMFYGSTTLRKVIIPQKTKKEETIKVQNNAVRFVKQK